MGEMVQMAKLIAVKQGYHAPMLFLDGTIAKAPMLLEQFPNEHEEKIKYLYFAGNQFSKKHEIGTLNKVFLVMEAWMATLPTDEPYIRPSQHPKRTEVLLIACLDAHTKEQTVTTLECKRDAKGNLRELKDMSLPNGMTAESPLLPAFAAGYEGR